MAKSFYIPERGDIVWLNFTPQSGHEQADHRPALILSPKSYNKKTSLCLACPLTTKIKGYPFEVTLPSTPPSVILSDQIKSLDWQARNATFKEKCPKEIIEDVMAKLQVLLPL